LVSGAIIPIEMSTVAPDATVSTVREIGEVAPMVSPFANPTAYSDVQVQVPLFCIRQVLVNASPGSIWVPSGMVTSLTNAALSQRFDGGVLMLWGVSVAVLSNVGLGDGERVGVGEGSSVGDCVSVSVGTFIVASSASTVWAIAVKAWSDVIVSSRLFVELHPTNNKAIRKMIVFFFIV
jgi:hypothetical protein